MLAPKNINMYDSSNREKVGPIVHMKLHIIGFFGITLLCDVGPRNIIMG